MVERCSNTPLRASWKHSKDIRGARVVHSRAMYTPKTNLRLPLDRDVGFKTFVSDDRRTDKYS